MNSLLDKLWSGEVKKYWKEKCPHCNNKNSSAAHIIGRNCKATRHIIENGIYACNELHREMEKGIKERVAICDFIYGKGHYSKLNKICIGVVDAKYYGMRDLKNEI